MSMYLCGGGSKVINIAKHFEDNVYPTKKKKKKKKKKRIQYGLQNYKEFSIKYSFLSEISC